MKKQYIDSLSKFYSKIYSVWILFLIIIFSLLSCGVTDTEEVNNTNITPYFTFKIDNASSVEVNCERISFVASSGGEHVQGLFGQSESVNSTFSYAFYGSSAVMDTLRIGEYPLLPYTGWSSKIPMHFSLKVPRTSGDTDYYLTVESTSSEYKHIVESIEKGDVENGMRIYYVSGFYKLKAKNIIDDEIVDIEGEYYFKLLTVDE